MSTPSGVLRRASCVLRLLLILAPGPWTPAHAAEEKIALQTLVVQPGDTLWGLAQKFLKDPKRWPEILKYNELPTDDPTVALPGMILRVPVVLIKEALRSAQMVGLDGEVLYRKKETPEWQGAAVGLELFPADSVRTMRLAEAHLRFGTGESLDIRENSLVILAPPRLDADAQILKGQVSARRSKIMTASARVTPKGADTEYTTRVLDDLRTLVQVYAGAASVEAQGKAVDVRAGFGSEVKLDQAPSLPTELPKLPEFSAHPGRSGASAVVRDGKFSLEMPEAGVVRREAGRASVEEAARYTGIHLQAARDAQFRDLALDRVIGFRETFDFTQELRAGRYWWRIALVDPLGFESRYTTPEPLDLAQSPPALELTRPADGEKLTGPAATATLLVEGAADPDAFVIVQGRDAVVDTKGRFRMELQVKPGRGYVKVEARNRWGVSKASRTFLYEQRLGLLEKPEEKPVLPEKSFEERVLKPYVIPTLAILVGVAVIILLLP